MTYHLRTHNNVWLNQDVVMQGLNPESCNHCIVHGCRHKINLTGEWTENLALLFMQMYKSEFSVHGIESWHRIQFHVSVQQLKGMIISLISNNLALIGSRCLVLIV